MTRLVVEGADRAAATMRRAAGDLDDLSGAHTEAGALALTKARTTTPTATGELLAGNTVLEATRHETVIGNLAEHAAPVHSGVPSRGIAPTPYLDDVAAGTSWAPIFRDAVTDALRQITGA